LDPISTEKVEQIMCDLGKQRLVLLVTHSLGQARRVSDYSAMIHNLGRLQRARRILSTEDLFASPASAKSREFIMRETGCARWAPPLESRQRPGENGGISEGLREPRSNRSDRGGRFVKWSILLVVAIALLVAVSTSSGREQAEMPEFASKHLLATMRGQLEAVEEITLLLSERRGKSVRGVCPRCRARQWIWYGTCRLGRRDESMHGLPQGLSYTLVVARVDRSEPRLQRR
jgi:hypothetical protein